MANLLEQLSEMTVVVADTGDLDAISTFKPRDATTNPSLILAAAQIPSYQNLIDKTLRTSRDRVGPSGSIADVVSEAIDDICVTFGSEILKIIPGRVSTEVDARLSFDTDKTIQKAKKIINLYEELGIHRGRILIKIASTWEGIKAAEVLEREGIHCNLTLLFGFAQAVACADARVTLISPFVGRILDWYKLKTGRESYKGYEDPGVISVTKIFNYFKKFDYKTEVMGASFRNIDEIIELAGCDLLTISPKLLKQLSATEGYLEKKLNSSNPINNLEKISIDKEKFVSMMSKDLMAHEKLAEGIDKFSQAIEELEQKLKDRILVLENDNSFALSA